MVCVPCLVVPVLLWVWFRFIVPLLWKIKGLIFPNAAGDANPPPVDDSKLKCPFAFCAKDGSAANATCAGKEAAKEADAETKKSN